MKHWIHYSALMLSLSIGACSSEDAIVEKLHSNNEIKEIVANMGALQTEETSSRTTVNMGVFESDLISLVWAEKDTIGIYPATGDQLSFPITDGIGTNTCTFNGGGWALKTSTSYTAYSPFNRANYYNDVTKLPVSMLGQKQVGNGSSAHIGKYDLQIAKGETPDNGKITFDFEHQVCFIRMDLTAPVAGTWKSITLKSDADFTTEATMDLTQDVPVITPKSTANSVTLELENVTTTDDDLTITAYMVVLPIDLSEKTLEVELLDSNGNVHYVEAEVAFNRRNFRPGYARWIKAAYEADVNGVYKNGVAYIAKAGNLKSILGDDYLNMTSLKIVGSINGTDIKCIREMAGRDINENETEGKLTDLDLSEATIVEGGDGYFKNLLGYIYTSNNVVGDCMFYRCHNLENIVLPNGITSIGVYAFSSTSLRTVEFPANLKSIGGSVFAYCSSLANIKLPDGITSIGEYAFSNCTSLSTVEFPANLKSIGCGAFVNCSSLTQVELPSGITSISTSAFINCSSLTSINIPASVISIGDGIISNGAKTEGLVFGGCSSLGAVYITDLSAWCNIAFVDAVSNPLCYGAKLYLNNTELSELVIPEDITEIKDFAFVGYKAINKVTLHNNINSIGEGAFQYCSSLPNIEMPNNITSIGDYAFNGCSSLASINLPNNVTSIGERAFQGCSSLTAIDIPTSVTSIGVEAFYDCPTLASVCITDLAAWCNITFGGLYSNPLCNGAKLYLKNTELTELVIPEDITEIKNHTFAFCTALKKVTIGNDVTSIGKLAFYSCSSLTDIELPDGITTINGSAFLDCSSLVSITIGKNITSIGDGAFDGCTALANFYCYATTPPKITTRYSSTFEVYGERATLYVPMGCVDTYNSSDWSTFFYNIQAMN